MRHLQKEDIPVDEGLDNPQWVQNFEPDSIGADTHDSGSNHPAVRTLSGAMDFLHGVEHDLTKFWETEIAHGRDPKNALPDWLAENLPYRPNKIKVTADVEASEDADYSTYVLGNVPSQAYQQILRPKEDRFRAVVTNWGPGIVYLSVQTASAPTPGNESNTIQIAVNGTREIRSRNGVYAYPTAGSSAVVDVQDEFGYRE